MKYLVIITLTILFAGCVTINKTYLPQTKKDTVYLPCNQIHLQPLPLREWPNWRYPFYIPGIINDTSFIRLDTIKIDTLKYSNDSTIIIRSYPLDSVRVLHPKKGG